MIDGQFGMMVGMSKEGSQLVDSLAVGLGRSVSRLGNTTLYLFLSGAGSS